MRYLVFFVLTLSLSAAPAPRGTEIALGEKIFPIGFTLMATSYALSESGAQFSATPPPDQKLLVVRYRLTNRGKRPLPVDRPLRFHAIDGAHRSWEGMSVVRLDGTGEHAKGVVLDPGQSRDLYVTVRIPAAGVPHTLVVRRILGSPMELHFPLTDSAQLIPSEFRDPKNPDSVAAILRGSMGAVLPLRTVDFAVEGEPRLLPHKTREDRRLLAVPVLIRNRANVDQLMRGLFAGSVVKDAAGRVYPAVWAADREKQILKPRGDWRGLVLFDVPADVRPASLDFVERRASRPVRITLEGRAIAEALNEAAMTRTLKILKTTISSGTFNPSSAIRSIGPARTSGPASIPVVKGDKKYRTKDLEDAGKRADERIREKRRRAGQRKSKPKAEGRSKPAPQVKFVRRTAVLDFERIKVGVVGKEIKREPYVMAFEARGRIRGGGPVVLFPGNMNEFTREKNWFRTGVEREIPAFLGRHEFKALEAYELFGAVFVLLDKNGSSTAKRLLAFKAAERVVSDRWKRLLDSGGTYDYEKDDATHARKLTADVLNRLKRDFTDGLARAMRYELELQLGKLNADDVIGIQPVFWVNAPSAAGLSTASLLADLKLTLTSDDDNYVLGAGLSPPQTFNFLLTKYGGLIRSQGKMRPRVLIIVRVMSELSFR